MSTNATAARTLDRDFLKIRHDLLNIAASLDRIERGEGAQSLRDDPRLVGIRNALNLLGEPESEKANRVQMIFSRPYEPGWGG